jgi:signal transduction histidine kinase/CheY-like chemotaxis protein/integral membrane sensor domain MASE1
MKDSDLDLSHIQKWVEDSVLKSNLILIVSYVLLAQVSYFIGDFDQKASPIWLPAGFLLISVLFGRRRLIPGLFIGILLGELSGSRNIFAALLIGSGGCLTALSAEYIYRYLKPHAISLGKMLLPIWLIVTSVLCTLISSSVGIFSLYYLNDAVERTEVLEVWFIWWMADVTGALIIAPLILSFIGERSRPSQGVLVRLIGLVVLSFSCFWFLFTQEMGASLLFITFPLLLLSFFWFGLRGASIFCLSFVLSAVFWAKYNRFGGFDYHEHIVLFDTFVVVLAITALAIAVFYQKSNFKILSILFLCTWTVSGITFFILKNTVITVDNLRFEELVNEASQSVQQRLSVYLDALRSGASFWTSQGEASRDEWRDYVDYLDLMNRYPGINGLGVIQAFRDSELISYIEKVREKEIEDFEVKSVPGVESPGVDLMGFSHYIITHIEPLEPNFKALGLDTASEVNRQSAGQRARDSGQPQMTDRIILVQDGESRPGFLIYYPMYKKGMPLDTVDARRKAFNNWSYAPFITESFFSGILGPKEGQIEFSIFDDESITGESFVCSTLEGERALTGFGEVSQIVLAGEVFSFGWSRGELFPQKESASIIVVTASLALGSCFFVGVILSLQNTSRRANEIVRKKTQELTLANRNLKSEATERLHAELESDTARKNAEQARTIAEEANSAKSDFLATMSHEIRTPMNSVLGFAELLSSTDLNNEQKIWLNYIESSGNTLMRIINDILDFSKIEAGKLNLEKTPFCIKALTDDAVGSFTTLAAEKGLNIELVASEKETLELIGDPIRVMQIITNLISNAIKFTSKGDVLVSLDWEAVGDKVITTFSVKDTGVGIQEEKLNGLFNMFTQADSSTTRKFGGTGLGLAICKRLSEAMGGQISAKSQLGVGAEFIVEIPFELNASESKFDSQKLSSDTLKEIFPEKLDVLLVDDNLMNLKLGSVVLKKLNCAVRQANSARAAIAAVRSQYFPIIFVDCQMPDMDGIELSGEIRKIQDSQEAMLGTSGRRSRVIAVTAIASVEYKYQCLAAGIDDYLRKPCKMEDYAGILVKYANDNAFV